MKAYSSNSLYFDAYISFAKIPETIARKRRVEEFLKASHLIEVITKECPKHQQIEKLIKKKPNGTLGRYSFWEIGNMAVVMVETYHGKLEDYECDELYVQEIPINIAPYCGRYNHAIGAKPWTASFLITSRLKKRQLDQIINRLIKVEKKLPCWNYVEADNK